MADDSDELRNLDDTLPYARGYLQETVLRGVSTSHLHLLRSWQYKLKDVGHSIASVDHHPSSKCDSPPPDSLGQPTYWEVKVLLSPRVTSQIARDVFRERYLVSIGVSIGVINQPPGKNPLYTIRYENCGIIRLFGYNPRRFFSKGVEAYAATDHGLGSMGTVVGCGFIPELRTVFFTHNGHLVYEVSVGTRSDLKLDPDVSYRRTGILPGSIAIEPNFGSRAFCFDINSHFRARFARSRYLASSLPEDILALIVEASLQYVLEYTPGQEKTRHIWSLSGVCKYWRTMCSRQQHDHWLILRSNTHLKDLSRIGPSFQFLGMTLHEDRRSPWFHLFLTSPVLPRLSSISNWTYSGKSDAEIYAKLAPQALSIVPALVRNSLVNLRVLVLRECNFSSWVHFARFIFAFPTLEHLELRSTDSCWSSDSSTAVAPRWIRFAQRLKLLTFQTSSNQKPCPIFYAWLFLAGRRRTSSHTPNADNPRDLTLIPEDISAVSDIVDAVMDQSRFLSDSGDSSRSIQYETLSDTRCLLSWFHRSSTESGKISYKGLALEFAKHGDAYQLSAVRIPYGYQSPLMGSIGRLGRLATLLNLLSNAGACRCEFNLGDFEPDCDYAIAVREEILLGGCERYGFVTFLCGGNVVRDTGHGAVAWMSSYPPSFDLDLSRIIEGKCVISWDVTRIEPGSRNIPWIKLYRCDEIFTDRVSHTASFVYGGDPSIGKAEVTLPGNIRDGSYFLLATTDTAPRFSKLGETEYRGIHQRLNRIQTIPYLLFRNVFIVPRTSLTCPSNVTVICGRYPIARLSAPQPTMSNIVPELSK